MLKQLPFVATLSWPALVLAIAVSCCATQRGFDCKQPQHESPEHQTGTSHANSVLNLILSPTISRGNDKKAEPQAECNIVCGLLKKTAADATAFFTLVLCYVVYMQLIWMTRQEKVLERSIAVADKAADAAILQANAAVGIELPILRAWLTELFRITEPIPKHGSYSTYENTGIPTKYSGISEFTFRNQGRSPAFISKLAIGYTVSPIPVGEPVYRVESRLPQGDTIEPNTEGKKIELAVTIEVSESEIAAMTAGTSHLWVYGQLTYTDFLDETINQYRFCWRYLNLNEGRGSALYVLEYVENAPPTYVGVKKEKK